MVFVAQQLTTSELRERIDSDVAQRQFVHSSQDGDTTITVSARSRCDDVTGCDCNNEQVPLEHLSSLQNVYVASLFTHKHKDKA